MLAAFAHPDDETILIGGTLAMLATRGASTALVSATRGEGGERGEPPITTQDRLGEVREAELRCAAAALGLARVEFLGYHDPPFPEGGEGHTFTEDLDAVRDALLRRLWQGKYDAVLTHGSEGEYGHHAHLQMHHACLQAVKEISEREISLYGVSAFYEGHPKPRLANRRDQAHYVIDIQPWFGSKLSAAECHRTQHALFLRKASEEAERRVGLEEVLLREESLHRIHPRVGDLNRDPLARFLSTHCQDAVAVWKDSEG